MTQDDIISMALEAGLIEVAQVYIERLERFAALVAAHERDKRDWKYNPETGEPLVDGWPLFSCLPPEKDVDKDKIIEGLTKLLELKTKSEEAAINMIEAAVLAEREACAKVCEEISDKYKHPDDAAEQVASQWCAAAIRARNNHEKTN